MSTESAHHFRFFRAGGFDQIRIETGADIAALAALDQKLWVALACPVAGNELDAKTLSLIDSDQDGRIRAPEVIAAVKWLEPRLADLGAILAGAATLPLAAIQTETEEGKRLLAGAREMLANLGKPDAQEISLEDAADTAKAFAQMRFNGDGIVPAESADDEALAKLIGEIIDCKGGETDRGGKPGVTMEKIEAFFADAEAFAAWWKKADDSASTVRPLGDATHAAASATLALRAKIDDFFARCRVAAYDARAAAALVGDEARYASLAQTTLQPSTPELSDLPLARIEPGRALPLCDGVNPAWATAMERLRTDAVAPLLGDKSELSESDFRELTTKLAAYDAWMAERAGSDVEKLGIARVREILASDGRVALSALVERDKALEAELNAVGDIERLIRYHRDLHRFLVNFVSFKDFYSRRAKAMWQAGTLFIDGKSCDLCMIVQDAGRHASMAGLAATYLLYCDALRKSTGEKISIVAAVTAGDTGDLMVGRNGVFYDRQGRDYDATVTKIIENPISLRQAFWSPYKKFVRTIEETVAKRAAAAEAAATAKMQTAAQAAVHADTAKPAAPPPPKRWDVGAVAAMGVAVGAIGTAISAFATGILKLPSWQLPLVFVAILLLISGPSMLIAYLKLRRRNLAPILDANGWAINTRAKLNIPFGTTLTALASLPDGAERSLVDPYAEKKSKWPAIVITLLVVVLAYKLLDSKGKIFEWTKGWIGTPPSVEAQAAEAAAKARAADVASKEKAKPTAAPKK
jgi:hypothetical protein